MHGGDGQDSDECGPPRRSAWIGFVLRGTSSEPAHSAVNVVCQACVRPPGLRTTSDVTGECPRDRSSAEQLGLVSAEDRRLHSTSTKSLSAPPIWVLASEATNVSVGTEPTILVQAVIAGGCTPVVRRPSSVVRRPSSPVRSTGRKPTVR